MSILNIFYDTYKDKLVLAHREGSSIDILDTNGNICSSIELKNKTYSIYQKTQKSGD